MGRTAAMAGVPLAPSWLRWRQHTLAGQPRRWLPGAGMWASAGGLHGVRQCGARRKQDAALSHAASCPSNRHTNPPALRCCRPGKGARRSRAGCRSRSGSGRRARPPGQGLQRVGGAWPASRGAQQALPCNCNAGGHTIAAGASRGTMRRCGQQWHSGTPARAAHTCAGIRLGGAAHRRRAASRQGRRSRSRSR